jgi:hypothetical protein
VSNCVDIVPSCGWYFAWTCSIWPWFFVHRWLARVICKCVAQLIGEHGVRISSETACEALRTLRLCSWVMIAPCAACLSSELITFAAVYTCLPQFVPHRGSGPLQPRPLYSPRDLFDLTVVDLVLGLGWAPIILAQLHFPHKLSNHRHTTSMDLCNTYLFSLLA